MLTLSLMLLAAPAMTQHDTHADRPTAQPAAPAFQVLASEKLPPASDRALEAIDKSPRHGEWVSIDNPGLLRPALRAGKTITQIVM